MPLLPRDLRSASLIATGLFATCLAVIGTAAAIVDARPVASAAPVDTPLRIGIAAAAMPLADGTRSHTQEGYEAILVRELGEQFGTSIELVALAPEDHPAALSARRVDAVLLRQPADAQPASGIVHVPVRTSRGQSVAMRSDTAIRGWNDLAGQRVCTARANVTGQAVAGTLAASLAVFDAPAEALIQLRTGACDAAIFDQAQLQALFRREGWDRFSASLPARERDALVLAVAASESDRIPHWRRAVSRLDTPAQWDARHRTWAANVALDVFFDQLAPDCH